MERARNYRVGARSEQRERFRALRGRGCARNCSFNSRAPAQGLKYQQAAVQVPAPLAAPRSKLAKIAKTAKFLTFRPIHNLLGFGTPRFFYNLCTEQRLLLRGEGTQLARNVRELTAVLWERIS